MVIEWVCVVCKCGLPLSVCGESQNSTSGRRQSMVLPLTELTTSSPMIVNVVWEESCCPHS